MGYNEDGISTTPSAPVAEKKQGGGYDPDAIAPVPSVPSIYEDMTVQLETESSHVGEYGTKRDLVRKGKP